MTTMKFSPLIKQEIPEDLEDNPAWSAIGGLGYDAINQRYLVCSYFQACESLCDAVLKREQFHDEVIFPILYCLRHGIELMLKWLVPLDKKILEKRFGSTSENDKGHDLEKYIKAFEEDYKVDESLVNWLKEISELDPKSTLFRYVDAGTNYQREAIFLKKSEVFVNLAELKLQTAYLHERMLNIERKQYDE